MKGMKILNPLKPHLPFILSIWVLFGAIYLKTLAPSILYIDAGTMVAAAYEPGIPNPPGFPTYIMLAHLFTKIPWGTILFRVQLLSVISALGVLTWVYFLVFRFLSNDFWFRGEGEKDKNLFSGRLKTLPTLNLRLIQLISLASAGILAFSYEFWSQTINTESYILTNLAMISLLGLVLTIPQNSKISTLRLVIGAIILGISTGTNPTIVQVIPALILAGIFFWKKIGIKKLLLIILIATIATVSVYSYLPIRALQHPFLNWGDPQTPELFFGHLRGEGLDINDPSTNSINGFTGSPQIFFQSAGRYFFLFFLQFTPVLAPLVLMGAYYLCRKNWKLFLILGSVPLVNMIFGGLYLSGNQESWFIASYVIFAIFIGFGLSLILKIILNLPKSKFLNHKSIYAIPMILALVPLIWYFPKLDRSSFILTQEYADNLYANLPPGSVLIGSGDFFNSLTLYEYDVVKRRPDVFPVVANMWYILPWYRENLRNARPDLMPKELEGMIKMDRIEEYNEVMNWYIKWLIDHGHPVFVTPMVFRDTVLAGTDAGKYKPDKTLKAVISGLVFRILPANDMLLPSEDSFNYKFKDSKFYEHPPFYIERNYQAAYYLLLQEYGMGYVAMEDFYLGIYQNIKDKEEKDKAYKQAEKYMDKAYAIAPFAIEVVNRKAIFAAGKGDLVAAIKFFKQAADIDPNSLEVRLNLAKAYEAAHQTEEAKKLLQLIIDSATDPKLKLEAQKELAKITGQTLAASIPAGWKLFEQKQQNFSFLYPQDWSTSSDGDITILTSADKAFSIGFYGGTFTDKPDDWVKNSKLQFTGKLERAGLAEIPGFEATAAYRTEADGRQTLEFVLFSNKRVLHMKVFPVGDNNMKELDKILTSIKLI